MSWLEDIRLLLLLLPISFVSIDLLRRLSTNKSLPPGPLGLPLIGNALSLDSAEPWKTYAKWGAKYGDIFYYRIFSQEVVVINSEKIAKDLLEKRSSNYSDRPFFQIRIPFGWANHFAWMPYGSEWRLARRFFHQSFRAEAALSFRPMQLRKSHTLLQNLFATPESYFDHLSTFSGSIIMSANYDYDMKPTDDPMSPVIERGLVGLQYLTPETTLVLNAFPFLLRLPEWFPGADLKRKAVLSSKYVSQMIEKPLSYAIEKINAGTAAPCLISELMNRKQSDNVTEKADYDLAVKQASWSAFVGGAETTSSALLNFILAMVLFPNVQEQARAEIEAVVGVNRLPDYDDQPALPYIEAVVRECLRWAPVVPLGVAHATINNDVYEGYHIPQGATVIANSWAMAYNETVYPNPTEFRPERFLDANGQLIDAESPSYPFGFGRRICPGRSIGEASIWAGVVSLMAVFEFSKAKDAQGNDIDFEPTFTSGVTRHPNPFPCCIRPRSHIDPGVLQRLIANSAMI